MEEMKSTYKKYALVLMLGAVAIFAAILLVSNFYRHPAEIPVIPPHLKVLHIVLLSLSALGGMSVLLLKKLLVDKVSSPDFKGNRVQALFTQGILVQLPSLVPLAAGFTMVFLGVRFQALLVYFYIFIGAYYIGFLRFPLWNDIYMKTEL